MRSLLACLLGLGLAGLAAAQEKKPAQPATRYGVTADLNTYPQSSAKEALRSVAKALERKRVEYVLAHLTDPAFVDDKVDALGGKFDELVREVNTHMNDD